MRSFDVITPEVNRSGCRLQPAHHGAALVQGDPARFPGNPGVVVARIAVEVVEVVEKPKAEEAEAGGAVAEEGAAAEGEKKEAPAKAEKSAKKE